MQFITRQNIKVQYRTYKYLRIILIEITVIKQWSRSVKFSIFIQTNIHSYKRFYVYQTNTLGNGIFCISKLVTGIDEYWLGTVHK